MFPIPQIYRKVMYGSSCFNRHPGFLVSFDMAMIRLSRWPHTPKFITPVIADSLPIHPGFFFFFRFLSGELSPRKKVST